MAKGSRAGSSSGSGGMFGGVVGHTGVVANVHTNCGPEDDTFYCKVNRYYNYFNMLISILMLVFAVYVLSTGKFKKF